MSVENLDRQIATVGLMRHPKQPEISNFQGKEAVTPQSFPIDALGFLQSLYFFAYFYDLDKILNIYSDEHLKILNTAISSPYVRCQTVFLAVPKGLMIDEPIIYKEFVAEDRFKQKLAHHGISIEDVLSIEKSTEEWRHPARQIVYDAKQELHLEQQTREIGVTIDDRLRDLFPFAEEHIGSAKGYYREMIRSEKPPAEADEKLREVLHEFVYIPSQERLTNTQEHSEPHRVIFVASASVIIGLRRLIEEPNMNLAEHNYAELVGEESVAEGSGLHIVVFEHSKPHITPILTPNFDSRIHGPNSEKPPLQIPKEVLRKYRDG